MLTITVFGPGCARCQETEKLVHKAVQQAGIEADVQKVSDIQALAKAGVLLTPAVAINGVVKSSGRIPREEEIHSWIAGN